MKQLLSCLMLMLLPASAQEWTVLEPGIPLTGRPGEQVLVRVEGPAGRSPELVLGKSRFTLSEVSQGLYAGFIYIPDTSAQLVLKDGEGELALGPVSQETGGRTFLAQRETVTRQGPVGDYDRLTPLYPGTRIRVDGARGGWLRAAGSGTWIDQTGGRLTEQFLPPNRLNRVVLEEADNGDALLALHCDRPGEVQVLHSVAGQKLLLRLEDTLQTCFDVKRPTGVAEFLGPILLRPLTSGAVEIELSAKEFSGYQIVPDPAANILTLRIRKPMPQTLKGLKITLDAGHGGPKDPGTVGHRGLPEKTLNLRVAESLAVMLRARGAEVTMTRVNDQDVASETSGDAGELQARIDRSIEAGDHLFLSLHHNARPSVEEGKTFHGTDVYWYQPHSQALAASLADPIADAVGEETRSYRWRSFYVIRQTHSPAVLIEFQYLSNPDLEETVLDRPDYPARAAAGVVKGLERYVLRGQLETDQGDR
ncbi:MAG: N-acetylmuramoyl-L-alanine amidase [Vulcanimicrobiota bacterium]